MEKQRESNRLKAKTINTLIAELKKEIPPLSKTELQTIKDAFYSGTEGYLFKRKNE